MSDPDFLICHCRFADGFYPVTDSGEEGAARHQKRHAIPEPAPDRRRERDHSSLLITDEH